MGPPESTIQKAPRTGSAVLVVTDGCDRLTYVFGDGIRASGGGSSKQTVPRALPNPDPKRHLVRFIRFSSASGCDRPTMEIFGVNRSDRSSSSRSRRVVTT